MPRDGFKRTPALRYFEDVLAVEFGVINLRRAGRPEGLNRNPIKPVPEQSRHAQDLNGRHAPNREQLWTRAKQVENSLKNREPPTFPEPAEVDALDESRQRPLPTPCDAIGLALSGGGIRSAAIGLGALQALHANGRLSSFDYISTVSGGGYIGGSLTANLAKASSPSAEKSLFGDGVADSPSVAHLRDYSNYLFPRTRSAVQNWIDVIAILLRGVLANAVPLLAVLLFFAILTYLVFPTFDDLNQGSYLVRLLDRATGGMLPLDESLLTKPFAFTIDLSGALAIVLVVWVLARSACEGHRSLNDANSWALRLSGVMVVVVAVSALLDLQPIAIHALAGVLNFTAPGQGFPEYFLALAFRPLGMFKGHGGVTFAGLATALSAAGQVLRTALAETSRPKGWMAKTIRVAVTSAAFLLAGIIVPLAVWGAYLYLSVVIIWGWRPLFGWPGLVGACVALFVLALSFDANAYSLLRFYRDRLSKAFLFWFSGKEEAEYLDTLKLSSLKTSDGPYPIINCALNVQGSRNANKRGRNADFFIFTPYFVGSDLTLYAPTEAEDGRSGMEQIDASLDLATAVAISGAAVSANMGSATVRSLTPTLALLNVRLGYWLWNPRYLARTPLSTDFFNKVRTWFLSRLWLIYEIFSLLDENSAHVYLTDGGNIENLGVYELLKRGCKLIVVVDAEADPEMEFGSLKTVERFARIDFGVRINLSWADIASKTRTIDEDPASGTYVPSPGPHCAIGRVFYPDGAQGLLLYFKSSVTGDEKDYVLDYKRRNPSFPHETTTDRFFTEEQFEVYRALGFHIVDHFFQKQDTFCWLSKGEGMFCSREDAFGEVIAALSTST